MKLCTICLLIGLLFTFIPHDNALAAEVKVSVDNKELSMDVKPVIEEGRTLVPLRGIFEKLGAKVDWDSKTKTVTAVKEITNIKLIVGEKTVLKNNKKVTIDVPAKVYNGRTLVPLRFVAEALGAMVYYDAETKTVTVNSKVNLQYANGFSIEYVGDGCKKVTDGEGRVMLLVPRGQEVPVEYMDLPVIYTPIEKVLFCSTTQASLVRPLDVWDSVAGVTTKKDKWTIDGIIEGLDNGNITYVGESSAPDYEKIQELNPDITFVYTGPGGQQSTIEKLEEMNLSYAVNNSWLEKDGLGRLEWIKFMATFFNKDEVAETYFNNVVKNVNNMAEKLKGETKPKVVWGFPYNGKVYVASSYVSKFIEVAGGVNLLKDVAGNGQISLEEFYAKAVEADIFIYPSLTSYGASMEALLANAPILEDIKAIQEEKVWCLKPSYYQAIDQTDDIYLDLATIFHPELFKGRDLKQFCKLPQE